MVVASPSCWQPVPRPTSLFISATVQRRAPTSLHIFSACDHPPVLLSACGGSMTPAPKSTPPVTVPPKHWLRPHPPRPLSAEMVMLFRYCARHSRAQIKKVSQDLTLAADIFCLVEGGASLPSSVLIVQLRAGFAAGARRWRRRRLGDLPRICAAIAEVVVCAAASFSGFERRSKGSGYKEGRGRGSAQTC